MKKFLSRLNSTSTWRILMYGNIALAVFHLVNMIVVFDIVFVLCFVVSVAFAFSAKVMIVGNELIDDIYAKNKNLAEIATRLLDELVKYKEHFGPLPEGEEKKEEQSNENEEVF